MISTRRLLPMNDRSAETPLVSIIREAITAVAGRRSRWRSTWRWRSITRSMGITSGEQLGPGRTGDFLTSPEASPYFGLTVARQLIEVWDRLGQPEHWEIREYGAGPVCWRTTFWPGSPRRAGSDRWLAYRLVESERPSPRRSHGGDDRSWVGDRVRISDPFDPLARFTGVLLGNEVADAFPAHRLIVRAGELRERFVTLDWRGIRLGERDAPRASRRCPRSKQSPHACQRERSWRFARPRRPGSNRRRRCWNVDWRSSSTMAIQRRRSIRDTGWTGLCALTGASR